ncbi:MAG: cell division protein ZapE [Rhodospirillaceae bacterium]|nr:cell division protein ZapE [Rhodospirillaceae bacterium]MBT4045277.1 cell division protein ZapE [Rhodospirillaceae bacterium]MBT4689884.1 cell division protein ZapE [Rhodospirillaceae bacterium]MBT5082007.1 cell division protein ZapE [Rhodospirillaceae bacterium]MBT5524785.1 cell division protein ZapE [Rhodospirillaceae bacterium]
MPDRSSAATPPKTPLERYRALRQSGEIEADPAQELAVEKLQMLHHRLAQYDPSPNQNYGQGWRQFLFGRSQKEPAPEGLYIYGDVGRGKSMLMDLFFDGAPIEKKRRVHFHEFMGEVHARINAFRKAPAKDRKGDDPLPPIAADIAEATWLLCFDEFEVKDIADAMILGRLFARLFELGVVVVSTSNRAPDELYKGGLNRQLFLPFIEALKQRLDILCLEGLLDYRLARMHGMPTYFTPLDEAASAELDDAFERLTDQKKGEVAELTVKARKLVVPQQAKGVARFSFDELCATALGAHDYLALGQHFHTVILSGIPALGPEKRNEARRFVILIDVLYDNGVKLVASAETEVEQIYPAGDGGFEFQRTVSRLMEMQSEDYFDAPHRAVVDL